MNTIKKAINWLVDLLRLLSQRLLTVLNVVGINFYSILLLVILYLFYWQFDQAKDLLVTLNQEEHWQVLIFFFTLITLAVICWYLPKYLYPENEATFYHINSTKDFINANVTAHSFSPQGEDLIKVEYNKMLPRIFGSLVVCIVALGILNVANEMDPFHYPFSAYTALNILLVIFWILLMVGKDNRPLVSSIADWLEEKIATRKYLLYGFFLIIFVILLFLGFNNHGKVTDISNLVTASLLIALGFLVFTVFRAYIPFFKINKNVVATLLFFSGLFSLTFLLINTFVNWSQKLNPLTCANLAFVFYLSALYWLRIIGKRKKVYLVAILGVTLLFLNTVTSSRNFYRVNYVSNQIENSDQQKYDVAKRLSLENYFKNWVDHRRGFINDFVAANGYFPIFVIASEGGGSRAAYWTSIVNTYLQNSNPNFYDQHLFALTGASGGITGHSTFFSMKEGGVADANLHSSARKMFEQNFLSGTLTRLLGFDIWQEVFGLNLINNRAIVLQNEWSQQLETAASVQGFEQPFLHFWYQEGTTQVNPRFPPLLLINTTYVQKGNHGIVSPVTFDSIYNQSLDLLARVDQVEKKKKTIPLGAATVLNASFPYICPAGFIEGTGNFVDAGYYDNLGAQSAMDVFRRLDNIREDMKNSTDSLYEKFKFIGVQIRNDVQIPSTSTRITNPQLTAPIDAIGNIRSGYNAFDLWRYSETPDAFYLVNLSREDIIVDQDTIRPFIPLARYLSKLAILAMDSSLVTQTRDVDSDLNKIVREMD